MLNQVGSTIFKRQSLTRTSMTFLLRARSSLSLCSFSCRSQRTWNDIKWPNRTRHQSYCHTNQHHAARLGPLQGPPFSPHASSLTFWSHLCPASWTGCDWEPYQSLRGIKRKGYFNLTRRSPPHDGKHLKHLELGWFHVRCIMCLYLRMLSLATFLIKVRNDSSLKPTSRSKIRPFRPVSTSTHLPTNSKVLHLAHFHVILLLQVEERGVNNVTLSRLIFTESLRRMKWWVSFETR